MTGRHREEWNDEAIHVSVSIPYIASYLAMMKSVIPSISLRVTKESREWLHWDGLLLRKAHRNDRNMNCFVVRRGGLLAMTHKWPTPRTPLTLCPGFLLVSMRIQSVSVLEGSLAFTGLQCIFWWFPHSFRWLMRNIQHSRCRHQGTFRGWTYISSGGAYYFVLSVVWRHLTLWCLVVFPFEDGHDFYLTSKWQCWVLDISCMSAQKQDGALLSHRASATHIYI